MRPAREKAAGFVDLLRPLQRRLEAYCRRMLRDSSLVEDVLQSALARAFAQFDSFAPGTNFKAWIYRFVTLEIFNQNRKRGWVLLDDIIASLPSDPAPDFLAEEMAEDFIQEPEGIFDHLEDAVAAALQKLAPAERAVFLLRAVGEFRYHEIHQLLSIPLGSVIGYLSRARHKLRLALADYARERGLNPSREELP